MVGSTGHSQPVEAESRSNMIEDHEGNDVKLLWHPAWSRGAHAGQPPPFPFQVYFTTGAATSASDPKFAEALVRMVESAGNWSRRSPTPSARFELNSKPFSSILACVAHQRREIVHRNRNTVHPRLLSTWSSRGEAYQGQILVIDRDDCLESGVVMAVYGLDWYRLGRRSRRWWAPIDQPLVETVRQRVGERVRDRDTLAAQLEGWWRSVGGRWMDASLARMNFDAASTVSRPAAEAEAPEGVQLQAVHYLSGAVETLQPLDGEDSDEDESEDSPPQIRECFDNSELFQADNDLPHLQSSVYTDLLDQRVVSVWDQSHSKSRPAFSFTLYVCDNVPLIRPKALFACLNKGFLVDGAWTLDVVQNTPSIEAAFDHHARISSDGASRQFGVRGARTRLVLERVANGRLPAELLDHIGDILMPPDIPNYSSRPLRPYQDVFLYLNERHLSNGPLLVYSNPRDYGPGPNQARSKYHAPYQAPSTLDQPLRVVFLRFWHRVADELHTLWSLCSPRLPLSAADTPTITLRIHVPDTLSPGTRQVNGLHNFGRGPPYDCTFSLRSTFHEPITIHKHPLFSHDLWWEALDLVHLATGEVVPEAASIYPSPGQDVADSWQQSRELGFARDHSPEPRHMQTLHPGQWTEVLDTEGRRIRHDMDMWLIERHEAGLLRRGPGRYALRLRKGVVVPRWTSGAVDERRGPYNLPPLALELEGGPEGGVQFDFLG